ncbi:proline-rich domain-containing protein [Niameybacter massiliensis]|uniref:proline-rich domain-containing protein n=1 Tax=Niameybacter massiliensis TaxID=1658108 RepID=UPI0006B644E7|nr:hypothetical protein [Niameybacter massiliensis]
MNFRNVKPMLAVVIATSLLTGCNTTKAQEYKVIEDTTKIKEEQGGEQVQTVKVQSIEGNIITAIQGELTENSGPPALPNGETPTDENPPALPDGEVQASEAPPALPNGEAPTSEAPPALPDGETPTGEAPPALPNGEAPTGETPPALPDGEAQAGEAGVPAKPEGGMPGENAMGGKVFNELGESISFTVDDQTKITIEMLQGTQEGTMDNIGVNDVLEIALGDGNVATSIVVKNLQMGGGFGGSHTVTQGTSAHTIDTDGSISNEHYASTGDDENALRVDGANVVLQDIQVEKLEGESSNTENGDFYGQNAALLATNGAQVTVENATVNTETVNGNGVFSYGEGTTVNISNSTIRTSARNSGGIQTTGGGTTHATHLDIETQGESAAAIRSDRGGGIVNVKGGTYTTNGTGSPAIYSTADISVADATLTANHSEAIVIEGKNSVRLENCNVVGSMDSNHLEANENIQNIMIYQSMSGDAEMGHSTFTAKGGSITAKQGDLFYVTNTTCTIELSDVKLNLANDILLKIAGNESSRGWGTKGSNGGKATVIATHQVLEGKMIVDEISTMDMTLSEGSAFTGSINETGNGGNVKVSIDGTSTWTLTGDSYITALDGDLNQIKSNGFNLYINGQRVQF